VVAVADRVHERALSAELGEFEFRAAPDGDGLSVSGYIAKFGERTMISDWAGDYSEEIRRGAFSKTLGERGPAKVKMQFNHGHDPAFGALPIGVWTDLREDRKGLWGEGRIHDTWHTIPIRAAIESGALDGMSFKFKVVGERWDKTGTVHHRQLTEVALFEAGVVVHPAYEGTSVGVRSKALDLYRSVYGQRVERAMDDSIYSFAPRQQALYKALEDVVEIHGKFDQSTGNDGAHYVTDNPFAAAGMLCSNCAFFEGPRACELVEGDVAPEAVCKFWVIPEELLAARSAGVAGTIVRDTAVTPVGGTGPVRAEADPPVGITRREMRIRALTSLGVIPSDPDRGAA